jgi:hypothetical protein
MFDKSRTRRPITRVRLLTCFVSLFFTELRVVLLRVTLNKNEYPRRTRGQARLLPSAAFLRMRSFVRSRRFRFLNIHSPTIESLAI